MRDWHGLYVRDASASGCLVQVLYAGYNLQRATHNSTPRFPSHGMLYIHGSLLIAIFDRRFPMAYSPAPHCRENSTLPYSRPPPIPTLVEYRLYNRSRHTACSPRRHKTQQHRMADPLNLAPAVQYLPYLDSRNRRPRSPPEADGESLVAFAG